MKNKNFAKEPFDFVLLIIVLIILALGIIMVMSASSPAALSETGNSYHYVKKQAICGILGLLVMIIVSKIDYREYRKYYKIIYFGVIILLASVIAFGKEVSGGRRWVDLGFLSFQPSEVGKIGLIVFYSEFLTQRREYLGEFKKGFLIPFLYLIPVIGILIGIQNHLSATVLIIMIISILMVLAGTKLKYFLTFGTLGATLGSIGLFVYAKITGNGFFRIKRIISFLDPFADPQGSGWQIIQSLYAIRIWRIIWCRTWK